MKKWNIKKCYSTGFGLGKLTDENEIESFHSVLVANLTKYNRKPMHTVNELYDLKRRWNEDLFYWGNLQHGWNWLG